MYKTNENIANNVCELCKTKHGGRIGRLRFVEKREDKSGNDTYTCLTMDERDRLPVGYSVVCGNRSLCRNRQIYYNKTFEDNKFLATTAPNIPEAFGEADWAEYTGRL